MAELSEVGKVIVVNDYNEDYILNKITWPRIWYRKNHDFKTLSLEEAKEKLFRDEYDIKSSEQWLVMEICNKKDNRFLQFLHFINFIVLSLLKLKLYNKKIFDAVLQLKEWGENEIADYIKLKILSIEDDRLLICYLLLLIYNYIYNIIDATIKQLIKNLMAAISVAYFHQGNIDSDIIRRFIKNLPKNKSALKSALVDKNCLIYNPKNTHEQIIIPQVKHLLVQFGEINRTFILESQPQGMAAAAAEPERQSNEWKCPECTFINKNTSLKCEMCSTFKPQSTKPKQLQGMAAAVELQPIQSDEWICPNCTLINKNTSLNCETCGTTNPNAPQSTPIADKWICPLCTFANNITSLNCEVCGTTNLQNKRQTQGMAAAVLEARPLSSWKISESELTYTNKLFIPNIQKPGFFLTAQEIRELFQIENMSELSVIASQDIDFTTMLGIPTKEQIYKKLNSYLVHFKSNPHIHDNLLRIINKYNDNKYLKYLKYKQKYLQLKNKLQ